MGNAAPRGFVKRGMRGEGRVHWCWGLLVGCGGGLMVVRRGKTEKGKRKGLGAPELGTTGGLCQMDFREGKSSVAF